jgi:hypothetical protein
MPITLLAAILAAVGIFAAAGVIQILARVFRKPSHNAEEVEEEIELPQATREPTQWHADAPNVPQSWPAEHEAYRGDPARGRLRASAAMSSASSPGAGVFYAAILVVCVFAIAIGVVYTLTHIGGPLEATVNATVAKAGGSILILVGGLFAAFFAVAFMAFVAIRVFSGQFRS